VTTHPKMAAVRLSDLNLVEAWVEGAPTLRARFDFPLTAASGCASSSVIYYEVDPGDRTPRHIHSAEEIQRSSREPPTSRSGRRSRASRRRPSRWSRRSSRTHWRTWERPPCGWWASFRAPPPSTLTRTRSCRWGPTCSSRRRRRSWAPHSHRRLWPHERSHASRGKRTPGRLSVIIARIPDTQSGAGHPLGVCARPSCRTRATGSAPVAKAYSGVTRERAR
jgi:hypothetical protein